MTMRLLCAGLALVLAGCATLLGGTTQSIRVEVLNAPGASCTGVDTQGQIYKWPNTPASAVVRKGEDRIGLTCEKPGFKTTFHVIRGQYLPTAMMLNIFEPSTFLLGMLHPSLSYYGIGPTIDRATGGVMEYPEAVRLVMEPEEGAPASLKAAYLSMKKKLDEELQKEAEEGPYLPPQVQPQEGQIN